MATVISCGALLGAWLLFLGAIYQAALELRAHVIARDRLAAVAKQVVPPPRVSAWWWLVPPWKYVLERRRSGDFRRAYAAAMSLEDFTSLIVLHDKGLGWSCVAVGALLLAASQTYTFTGDRGWSCLVFVLMTLALTAVSILTCVIFFHESDRMLRVKREAGKF